MQQMAVELDRTFLTYIQQQLFIVTQSGWKLQEELYLQGTPSDGTGARFLYPSLSSDPFTELASN